MDIGAGTHTGTVSAGAGGILYRVQVPANTGFMFVNLQPTGGGAFNLFARRGERPVLSYPLVYDWEYDCLGWATADLGASCAFTRPAAMPYYILVAPSAGSPGGAFQMTLQLPPLPTATPTAGGAGGPAPATPPAAPLSARAPNDTYATATPGTAPLALQRHHRPPPDQDYLRFTARRRRIYPAPGRGASRRAPRPGGP